jgi:hypothetical protein
MGFIQVNENILNLLQVSETNYAAHVKVQK